MSKYNNSELRQLSVEGNQPQDLAHSMWLEMSPTERAEKVMANVDASLPMAQKYRACINYIQENLV